ncbi:MAG: hypothetical protein ACHQET_04450 [Chitinophagales bacterium]
MKPIFSKIRFLEVFLILVLASCKVMLIGAYDQVTDENIQKIQVEVMTLLVKIERNLDAHDSVANRYDHFKDRYELLAGETESLKVRCQSIPKYNIVVEQVSLLQDNLQNLEKYHQIGFRSTEELVPIKKAFESEFGAMITLQNSLKRKKTD